MQPSLLHQISEKALSLSLIIAASRLCSKCRIAVSASKTTSLMVKSLSPSGGTMPYIVAMALGTAARIAATSLRYNSLKGRRWASGNANASAFDLQNYMLSKSVQVNKALESALSLPVHSRGWQSTCPAAATKLHDAIRYSLLNPRSKRVCGIACIAACEMVGGYESIALPAACSLEMITTMCVVHDDLPCMDNGQLRRGKPACHRAFGENLALLAGDALLAMAFEHLVSSTCSSTSKLVKVAAEMARSARCMASGQLAIGNEPDVTMANLEFVHVHKTAVLLQASLVSGGILGGAADEQVEALRNCGLHAGLMYQIVDDILDVTQSSEQLGKVAGSDSASGKATYPKLIGLEESRLLAQKLRDKAKKQLAGFEEEKATPLLHFVDFMASRLR